MQRQGRSEYDKADLKKWARGVPRLMGTSWDNTAGPAVKRKMTEDELRAYKDANARKRWRGYL